MVLLVGCNIRKGGRSDFLEVVKEVYKKGQGFPGLLFADLKSVLLLFER